MRLFDLNNVKLNRKISPKHVTLYRVKAILGWISPQANAFSLPGSILTICKIGYCRKELFVPPEKLHI